ncbi:hypothetical protein [Acetobacter sp.]|uniref:hypothetical protein n=1 Tax=Acetobacter sp. TaxID=440 RepID=UPI0039E7BB50
MMGVPSLLGAVEASASSTIGEVASDYLVMLAAKQWGIYTTANAPVLISAHVESYGVRAMSELPFAPQENGAFSSYNKVRHPNDHEITLVCDGSTPDIGVGEGAGQQIINYLKQGRLGLTDSAAAVRKNFVDTLNTIAGDLNLYNVTMPERTYLNVNILGYEIFRSNENGGASIVFARVFLKEIKLDTIVATAIPTQDPQGASLQNSGNVQTQSANIVEGNIY